MALPEISSDNLDFLDAPRLIWIHVQEALKLLWDENPKLHDLGGVISSIVQHGFQELPKYDAALAAIKAGNGRIEALAVMEQNKDRDGYELPRGLAIDKQNGAWTMPLLVGTDAQSRDLARAYAIDSNNLTMSGGDFTAFDMARLWDTNSYLAVLKDLHAKGKMPTSVNGNDLDLLMIGTDLETRDMTGDDDVDSGVTYAFKVEVKDATHLEDAITAVKKLLDANAKWKAKIIL